MSLKLLLRKAHKWVSLIIAVQLFLWTLSGLIMTLLPIEKVRSEHLTRKKEFETLDLSAVRYPIGKLPSADPGQIQELRLRMVDQRPVYEMRLTSGANRLFSAIDGRPIAPLSREQVISFAKNDFAEKPAVVSAELLQEKPPIEYRGKLPVWKVAFDNPEESHVYVSPADGQILARRSGLWRIYDFFWMLHIMDYKDHENFNHPLLIMAALLGVLTSLSGVALLFVALPRRKRG